MFVDKIVEYIYKKYNKLSRNSKILAPFILTIVLIVGSKGFNNKKELYLVDLKDRHQNTAVLLDENGNEILIDSDDMDCVLAIVDSKRTKSGELYPVVLVDDDGIINKGLIDGKFLKNKSIDEITINNDVEFGEMDLYDVVPKKGAYVRTNKKVDKKTDKAKLLPFDEKVISSGITEVSNDNNYDWMKVIYYNVNDKTISNGYMASDFIINSDYELSNGKKFIVNTDDGINLKLRENPNTDSNIITELKDGTEVILIPKFSSESDGKYDWFYIACLVDGEWKYGYSAATYYKEDGEIENYLQEANSNSTQEEKKYISKVVDTSEESNVDLKLREKPGTSEKIVSRIENGTTIYVNERSIDSPINMDDYLWVEAETLNGDVGYVALQFLKDKIKKEDSYDSDLLTIDFIDGTRKGYLGIDINNTIDPNKFSTLLTNEYEYKFNTGGYKINNNGDIVVKQKPDFVYLKLGATGTGTEFSFSTKNEVMIDNVSKNAKLCEKNNVPYGYYYYSQATTESEIEQEVAHIKKLLNRAGISKYGVLSLVIDFEDKYYSFSGKSIDTRIKKSADINGKDYQTFIINKIMNRVREETNMEVVLYTDNNTLRSTFNFENLDGINQQNCWITEVSQTHTKNLVDLDKYMDDDDKVSSNREISQIMTDTSVNDVGIDIDFMEEDYFNKCLKKVQ